MNIRDTRNGYYGAYTRFFYFHSFKSVKFVKFGNFDFSRLFGIVCIYDYYIVIGVNHASVNFAYTDSSYIFIVVNGTDKNLCAAFGISFGCGNIINDGLE